MQTSRSDILVPVNLEKRRFEGVEYAANAASLMPVDVTLLYVVELNVVPLASRVYDDLCLEYQHRLQNVAESFFPREPRLRIRVGKPHEEILAEARESEVELIVMAAPKTQQRKWLFGPRTVKRVVRDAPCLTLVLSESWKLTPAHKRAKTPGAPFNANLLELARH